MTAQDLARLIVSYEWLSQEMATQTELGATATCAHIREELEALFLKIVEFPVDDPRIICAQIEFLVTAMGAPGGDDAARALLRDMTLSHLKRLTKALGKADPTRGRQRNSATAARGIEGRSFRTGSA
ncbi:MAG: hypothetical protein AB7E81_21275 [Hyphomicrobiaceae bacterium]